MKDCESRIRDAIGFLKDFALRESSAKNIEAIVLTGSYSREQGAAILTKDRQVFSYSDIEFVIILSSKLNLNQEKKRFDFLSKQAESALKQRGMISKVRYGVTDRRHLRSFKPVIFCYELKKFGKVIWGDKDILHNIPSYRESEIEPMDGFILLNNRIVEQLELLNKIEANEPIYQYEFDKGYIQIINSLLAFNKRYTSLYPEKEEAISKLLSENKNLSEKLTFLKEKAKEAFSSLGEAHFRVVPAENALNSWKELGEYFKKVWLYEAEGLLGDIDATPEETIHNFISLPDIKSRIKGWLKTLTCLSKLKTIGLWNMSIWFFETSPQFLLYQQAVKAYFNSKVDSYTNN